MLRHGSTCSAWAPWPRSGWRSCPVSRSPWVARTGGITTPSGTSSTACTCGASSCSWRCWSSTWWGKFWMGAWRGSRQLTWITGVVAFVASVIECFTGYLSQQNFDSQWIATSGKDAFNSVGVGAFFNVMNFGQMLMWHIVLIPIALIAIIGAHVLLVRVRGVSHPIDAHPKVTGSRRLRRRAIAAADAAPWRGPNRRYDLLKEGTIASVVVLALTLGLAGLLSSPDVPPITIATWSKLAPADFLATRSD